VGIPVPSWPSSVDIARPTLPTPWSSDQAGFYFIASSGCSDSNTYGNPTAPRCSIPGSPGAGAVIALNGTISGVKNISFSGTAANPIWIMAYNPTSKPSATHYWDISGSYVILDSIAFNINGQDGVVLDGHHLMLRNSTMVNPFGSANGAGFGIAGQHIIFYKNVISQLGNWEYDGPDVDRHGIKVSAGSDIWIIDSTFYHGQGDGIQVGDQNNASSAINKVYIGRNVAYENLQFGFWTKNATDVIFSENTAYNHTRSTDSGPGGGLGGQYDPKYVWFLNNTIYNAKGGIHIAGSSNGGGGPWYAIGNVIHSITSGGNCNSYDYGALSYRNEGGFTVLFNTVYDVDFFGGYPPSGGTLTIRNNIFASKKSNSCDGFETERTLTHDYNLFSSAAYDPGAEAHRVVGDPMFVSAPANFELQAASPAIDAGSTSQEAAFAAFQSRYGIDIKKDALRKPRPQQGGWDMGAYEFGLSGVPSAPSNLRIVH
jgi:hypothetical protein